MPVNIVISGETLTGKTMVALALSSKIRADGKKVSYFKPAGQKSFTLSTPDVDVDEDAAVMKEFLGMDTDLSCICPITRTHSRYDELASIGHESLKKRVKECYNKISEGMDYVIIEGTKAPWHLLHVDLSTPQIAKLFDAKVLCLVNFPELSAIDDILLQKHFFSQFGITSIGIVLNMVPPMLRDVVSKEIPTFLKEQGLQYCGVIYQKRELYSPSIRDILQALEGEMIIGEDQLDCLIDQFLIGSMAPENALKWFRRMKNGAIITSGDRSDICIVAMESGANLLILTGGMGPDIQTLSRAKEEGIPILMTAHDTYTTGHIVDGLVGTVTPENKEKIAVIERIVGESLDFDSIGI